MCAGSKPLEPVAAHHDTPRPPTTLGCESRRRLVRIVPPIYGLPHCVVHTNCLCNDIVSIRNRVLGEVPLPTKEGIRQVRRAIKKLWPVEPLHPLTLEQALATFKGRRWKVYTRAYESLKVNPLDKRDATIKSFVKAERFDPGDKENPDPRPIQARDPRFNIHFARFLRPLEPKIYGLHRHGYPVVAKCKNPQQRADLLLQKWGLFRDPVCVSLDSSRWDKHVSSDMLRVEHDFYQAHYPGNADLAQLLKWQAVNHCKTSNGFKYSVSGGRMSGDMNTASGNIILACGMVYAACRQARIRKFEVIDDGDDILLIIERSDLARVREQLPNLFLTYGQELKIENIADDIHQVVFCQSRMTWNGERYIFARNWRKVLSQSCCGTKHWNDPFMVRPMFGLIGDCELAQHAGVPIIQAFATKLRELSRGARCRMECLDSSYQYRLGNMLISELPNVAPRMITQQARYEFELTWGVTPTEQLAIEEHLSHWNPSEVLRDLPQEMYYPWIQHLDPTIRVPTCL